MSDKVKLTITVVSRDPKLLETRAVSAVNDFASYRDRHAISQALGSCANLQDGGGWSWELGEVDAAVKATVEPETYDSMHLYDGVSGPACCSREWQGQATPGLRLTTCPDCLRFVAEQAQMEAEQLKRRLAMALESLAHRAEQFNACAEARGAKRNAVEEALDVYWNAVRESHAVWGYFEMTISGSKREKKAEKLKAKLLRIEKKARERLLDLACGGAQEGGEAE